MSNFLVNRYCLCDLLMMVDGFWMGHFQVQVARLTSSYTEIDNCNTIIPELQQYSLDYFHIFQLFFSSGNQHVEFWLLSLCLTVGAAF